MLVVFLITAIRTFNLDPSLTSEIIKQLLVTLLTHAHLAPVIKSNQFAKTMTRLFDRVDHFAFIVKIGYHETRAVDKT